MQASLYPDPGFHIKPLEYVLLKDKGLHAVLQTQELRKKV